MVFNPLPHKNTPFIDVFTIVHMYISYYECTNSSLPRDVLTLKINSFIGNDYILFDFLWHFLPIAVQK